MGDDVLRLVGFLCLVAFLVWFFHRFGARAQALLRNWAKDAGYQLLLADVRLFRKGPFLWSSRSQVIYRVVVRDREGQTRVGWLRCGSWWQGVFADQVEVKWDE